VSNHKVHKQKKNGLYKLLLTPSKPCENVSMDFMTQLPKWNGMDVILVVVDRFSNLVKMAPPKTIVTTFDSVKLFFDMWVKHHRMPQFIVNDKNAKFITDF